MGVACQALAGYACKAGHPCIRYLPERLALLNCRDVDLDRRDGDRLERVEDRDARMGVGRRVDNDAVHPAISLLDPVDDRALVVGLEDLDAVEPEPISAILAD